jgi:hypothetical protein
MLKNLFLISLIIFNFACDDAQENTTTTNGNMNAGTPAGNMNAGTPAGTSNEIMNEDHFREALDELMPLFEKICLLAKEQEANCASQLALEFTGLKIAYDANEFGIDLSKLETCVENFSLDANDSYFKECGLFIASRNLGDTCLSSFSCKNNLTCSETDNCGEQICMEETTEEGAPLIQYAIGENCSDSFECVEGASCVFQNDDYFCVSNDVIYSIQENENCDPTAEDLQCAYGLLCVTELVRDQSFSCKPIVQEGETCYFNSSFQLSSNCGDGYYCEGLGTSPTGVCTAFPSARDGCGSTTVDEEIVDFCYIGQLLACIDGTCQNLSLVNEACSSDEECLNVEDNLQCMNGTCQVVSDCK